MILTEEIRTILLYSRDEAMRTGCYAIAPEHLLLGILRHGDNAAVRTLGQFGLDPAAVKADLDGRVFREQAIPYSDEDDISFTRSALNICSYTLMEAMRCNQDVSSIHLLAALCDCPGDFCSTYLHGRGITLQVLRTIMSRSSEASTRKTSLPETEDLNKLLSVFYRDKEIFS